MKRKFLSARETARVLGKSLTDTIAHFEEADRSHDQTETALRNYLRAARGVGPYRWLRAVYDSFFVWEQTDENGVERLYRADYSIDDAGALTVGAPGEVQMDVKYVPVAQAASESSKTAREIRLGSMREAKIGDDGMVLIKIIDAGVGSCGYYSAEVLKAACEAGKFPAGLQMFANHRTAEERAARPEGEIEKIVAITREAGRWDENGPDGPAVYAKAQITAHWRPMMESLMEDIGTSWDGMCAYSWGEVGGKEMPIVEELLNVTCVDFVTRAGRGGKIMSLQEAARESNLSNLKPAPDKSPATNPTQSTDDGGETQMNEAQIKEAKEAAKTEGVTQGRKEGRIEGVKLFQCAQKTAREALANLALPDVIKDSLVETAIADLDALPMKEDALDTAALSTRVKDAAEREAVRAREAYGYGAAANGATGHQGGDGQPMRESDKTPKFADVDAALAGIL